MNNRQQMPLLDKDERIKSFEEVALGYTKEQAIAEANRCLGCKNAPCKGGCPVGIDIPAFIEQIKKGEFIKAYQIINATNTLSAVTGRVCPQETQCEKKCVRGVKGEAVAIGALERFVSDYYAKHKPVSEREYAQSLDALKVAIIGSGPCGLTVAGDLIELGYSVTVFEALHKGGGVLTYGIPAFRLPKDIVQNQIEELKNKGVEFVFNAVAGKSFTFEDLQKWGYKAIIVGSGAGLPRFMGIDGEMSAGVCSANEFLTRVNLMEGYKPNAKTPVRRGGRTIVVGGGNVAMDAARSAKRLGSSVCVVYRRGERELPARREEVIHAMEEGIEFNFMTNPVKINANENGAVKSVTVIKMQMGEPDESGRASPIPIEGSEYDIECDAVIMALGTSPNPLTRGATDSEIFDSRGRIVVDENGATKLPYVFAGGDAVTGAATVILAMGAGKQIAKSVHEYLKKCN